MDREPLKMRFMSSKGRLIVGLCLFLTALGAAATEIVNPGFEEGWNGWTDTDPGGSGTALSDVAHSGSQSVKLTEKGAFVAQTVPLESNTTYRLSAYIRGPGSIGAKVGAEMYFEQQPKKSKKWQEVVVTFQSGTATSASVFVSGGGLEVRFDDFSLEVVGADKVDTSARIISSRAGGYGLSPDLPPGRNFDLLGWYLNTPADQDKNGISDRFSEVELAKGAEDERYFYTASDGGMVFRATVAGAKTSKNTRFTRTELREMLRRGNTGIRTKNDDQSPNKNNWVLSSAPAKAVRAAGGVDGKLRATLAINHVTQSGSRGDVGRVIIGQIHAAKDEPVRLYYRKLPGNSRGSIYVAHEISGGDDIFFDLIGSRSNDASNPAEGFALNEKFSYEIEVKGNSLQVKIFQNETLRAEQLIDISNSGYDVAKEYMYFKAGVYNQNNSGDADDYAQATFYELEASHD